MYRKGLLYTALVVISCLIPQAIFASVADIEVNSPLTNIGIDPPRSFSYDLGVEVTNNSETIQTVEIRLISGPFKEWQASVFNRYKQLRIDTMELAPGAVSEDLSFHFFVPQEATSGTYKFLTGYFDGAGQEIDKIEYVVSITRPETTTEDLFTLEPRYTTLTGPVGESFTFNAELSNKSTDEHDFDLRVEVPEGWQAFFKPSFEDTQIASISIEANGSTRLQVLVQPPLSAAPGSYPIVLGASNKDLGQITKPVQVELTGSPELTVTTMSGRLNSTVIIGESTDLKLVVFNSGTSPLDNIRLLNQSPEGWVVDFDHNLIPRLESQEAIEITASISAAEDTLPGDYSIKMVGSSLQAVDTADFRITVLKSSTFGWVGISVLILVALVIGALFLRLGRR